MKAKSRRRQLAPVGTVRSIFRIETSKSLLPRTFGPESSVPDPPSLLGSSASAASPLVMIPKVVPFVGIGPSAVDVPFGRFNGGTATNDAPVTAAGLAIIAAASAAAPALSDVTGVTAGAATVMVRVATFESVTPSLACHVKLSPPV